MSREREVGDSEAIMNAKSNSPFSVVIAIVIALGALYIGITVADNTKNIRSNENATDTKHDDIKLIPVPVPPLSEDTFPCSDCHVDLETDSTPRVLEDHHEDLILKHGKAEIWCMDCHDAGNRDKLHLANGKLIDFKDSYRLCGQCHGQQLRDLLAGAHGKRTGFWSGKKNYLLCAHCHNAHSPEFKPVRPEPPPVRPEDLR